MTVQIPSPGFKLSEEKFTFVIQHGAGVACLIERQRDVLEARGGNYEITQKAALYHDFGKLLWPDELFSKPSKLLSCEDWQMIYCHPEHGISFFKEVFDNQFHSGNPSVFDLIFLHHEKPDGSGYYRIKELPVEVAFLSICDVFDACVKDRPYRKGMPANVALKVAITPWKDFLGGETILEIAERLKNAEV